MRLPYYAREVKGTPKGMGRGTYSGASPTPARIYKDKDIDKNLLLKEAEGIP